MTSYLEQITQWSAFFSACADSYKEFQEKIFHIHKVGEKIKALGTLGWTALPNTYFDSYLECGSERKEDADSFFMNLLTPDAIANLMDEIRRRTDSIDDVEEAIANYEDARYKSCMLVLFSMKDSILINSQTVSSTKK